MSLDDTAAKIRRMLVNDLFVERGEDQILLDLNLQQDLGVDSIGFEELRILCERKFGVSIPDDDFIPDNFSTVRRICNLIAKLQGTRV